MPKLLIVGRRGWENEMIVDMLERCETIHAFVEEKKQGHRRRAGGPHPRLRRSADAVFLPKGFGLPVVEALAAGRTGDL